MVGIFKLEVENSFINYFDKEQEFIRNEKIDDDLGGTTPLNIILKFPVKKKKLVKKVMSLMNGRRKTKIRG